METTNQVTVTSKTDSIDYSVALHHYFRYDRRRSMWKFSGYARTEWPAMKRVLESRDVEILNNISEQTVRKLKINLRKACNTGSESSAANNAFIYSIIESCKNDMDPSKSLRHLLKN